MGDVGVLFVLTFGLFFHLIFLYLLSFPSDPDMAEVSSIKSSSEKSVLNNSWKRDTHFVLGI